MSDTGASPEAATFSNDTAPTNRPAGPAPDTESNSTPNYGLGLTLLGGITDAFGRYRSGKANKKVADFNAHYARVLADQAVQAGQQQSAMREAKERVIEGATRSGFAAQGVVVGAGTSRAVLAAEENASAIDKMNIEINARRQAYGYQVNAADQDARGDAAALSGKMGAISSLLDTGSQYLLEDDPSYAGSRRKRGN